MSKKLKEVPEMKLGAFSISLSVKDLERSRAFYATLGFEVIGGDAAHNYLIMRNGDALIGLFQGMFERNTLTFNPGFDQQANTLESFTDVRKLQTELKAAGIELTTTCAVDGTGPAHIALVDPDGNPILIDQHV